MDSAELVEAIRQARAIVDAGWPDRSDDVMIPTEVKLTAALTRANLVVSVALQLISDRSDSERRGRVGPRCPECLEKSLRCVDCGKPLSSLFPHSLGRVEGTAQVAKQSEGLVETHCVECNLHLTYSKGAEPFQCPACMTTQTPDGRVITAGPQRQPQASDKGTGGEGPEEPGGRSAGTESGKGGG